MTASVLAVDTARRRILAAGTSIALGCSCAWPLRAEAAVAVHVQPSLSRRQLIGAWRLVAIEYRGPQGETVDPFYQPDSTGLLVYAASGWMSVQIHAPRRAAWPVPAERVEGAAAAAVQGLPQASDLRRAAAAFDSYYAYYGTWDFDPRRSLLTHHVSAGLIAAESGSSYEQRATLENGRLVLAVGSTAAEGSTMRRKVWERVPGAASDVGMR